MQTIFLATFGTYGDISPFLSIAARLRDAGAHPVLFLNPGVREYISEPDFETRWVGEPVVFSDLIRREPKYLGLRGGEHVVRDCFNPYSRALFPVLVDAIRSDKPDRIAFHVGCFSAGWAAQAAGIPNALIHLAPLTMMTTGNFGVYPFALRMAMKLAFPLAVFAFQRLVVPVARDCGVRPRKGLFIGAEAHCDKTLGLWSKRFRDVHPSDPANLVICGFPCPNVVQPMPEPVAAFLRSGEPPVAIGFGTSVSNLQTSLPSKISSVCLSMGQRVLVVGGRPLPDVSPESALWVPSVPYESTFPACSAIVHHGGIGTTGSALRSGRPTLIIPFAHDQFDNAYRVKAMGAGTQRFRWGLSKRAISKALSQIIGDSRAATIGELIRCEPDGASVAANELLK